MKLQQLAVLLNQSTRNYSYPKDSGVKNSTASVVSYPALTFFLKKVRYFFRDNTRITSLYRTKY